jgi:hypothetical protein
VRDIHIFKTKGIIKNLTSTEVYQEKQRTGDVAQAVEYLPSKQVALSSNPTLPSGLFH